VSGCHFSLSVKPPALAVQVTVEAVERLGVDAAIIFADILLIVEPMGVGFEFSKGDGPVIQCVLATTWISYAKMIHVRLFPLYSRR
jgi:uroporphyrinogen-III decarboxylase